MREGGSLQHMLIPVRVTARYAGTLPRCEHTPGSSLQTWTVFLAWVTPWHAQLLVVPLRNRGPHRLPPMAAACKVAGCRQALLNGLSRLSCAGCWCRDLWLNAWRRVLQQTDLGELLKLKEQPGSSMVGSSWQEGPYGEALATCPLAQALVECCRAAAAISRVEVGPGMCHGGPRASTRGGHISRWGRVGSLLLTAANGHTSSSGLVPTSGHVHLACRCIWCQPCAAAACDPHHLLVCHAYVGAVLGCCAGRPAAGHQQHAGGCTGSAAAGGWGGQQWCCTCHHPGCDAAPADGVAGRGVGLVM